MAEAQPIILEASEITFPATAANDTVRSPITKIRNDDSVGVNIDRIVLRGVSTEFAPVLGISLRWRNEPLTNGFVPFGGVAWSLNPEAEQDNASAIVLAQPVYLAPGEFIDVALRNDTGSGVSAGALNVIGIGRQCTTPSPWLPYLSAYASAIYDGTSAAAIAEVSDPTQLGNPFTSEMVISHFVSRVFSATAAAGPFTSLSPSQAWSTFMLRLADHKDALLIPKPTPLSIAIDVDDYAWPVNYRLAPRGYLKLEVSGTATWNTVTDARYARAVFGMQGYRRIG